MPSGLGLYKAAERGADFDVLRMLNAGVDPDKYRHEQWNNATSLHIAASEGHVGVVNRLLEAHCDVNLRDSEEYTALHRASEKGHVKVVRLLLQKGCDVDVQQKDGKTALYLACKNGHCNVVEALMRKWSNSQVYFKGAEPGFEWNPLFLASSQGHLGVVEFLLNAGWDVNECNQDGITPLQAAASTDQTHIMKELVKRGADMNPPNSTKNSVLYIAAQNGNLDTVKVIVEELGGIDLVSKKGVNDDTPIDVAQKEGHIEVANYLLKNTNTALNNKETSGDESVVESLATGTDELSLTRCGEETPPMSTISTSQQLWKYKILSEPLGEGAYGSVYLAQHENGGPTVALKKITWRASIEELALDPRREVAALMAIPQHKNIINFLDHHVSPQLMVIVLELCEMGDLDKYFKDTDPSVAQRVDLMELACCGLLHLHSQNPPVVHRDLKPANMLMKQDGENHVLKLADFGFARPVDKNTMKTFGGTLSFMAPEMLPMDDENLSYTKEVDIFSLGVVFQAMLRFQKGDSTLKPIIEGAIDVRMAIPLAMHAAHGFGKPIPEVVVLKDDDTFYEGRVKYLIKHMTRYEVKDRIKLPTVHKEITNIKDSFE